MPCFGIKDVLVQTTLGHIRNAGTPCSPACESFRVLELGTRSHFPEQSAGSILAYLSFSFHPNSVFVGD
jgi:hypothetical protein